MLSFFTLIRLSPASLSPTPINIKLTFQALEFYLLFKVSLSTPVFTDYPFLLTLLYQGFPDSSGDKESTCNAGDPSSIPGSARSAGEGIGYLLQYSWASLVAQLVKNLPAMWKTYIQSLGWDDSPGGGRGYPLQYSGLENYMDCIAHGVTKSQM